MDPILHVVGVMFAAVLRVSAGRTAWPGSRTPRQLPGFRIRKEKSVDNQAVLEEDDSNQRSRHGETPRARHVVFAHGSTRSERH